MVMKIKQINAFYFTVVNSNLVILCAMAVAVNIVYFV